jgi:hypothetical protein
MEDVILGDLLPIGSAIGAKGGIGYIVDPRCRQVPAEQVAGVI